MSLIYKGVMDKKSCDFSHIPSFYYRYIFHAEDVHCSLSIAPYFSDLWRRLYPSYSEEVGKKIEELILSCFQMIFFLKGDGFFGIYFRQHDSSMRFHMELKSHGHYRFLVLGQEEEIRQECWTGELKVHFYAGEHEQPYTSLLSIHKLPHDQILHKIMMQSIQVACLHKFKRHDGMGMSLLIQKLPPKSKNSLNVPEHQADQESITSSLNDFCDHRSSWPAPMIKKEMFHTEKKGAIGYWPGHEGTGLVEHLEFYFTCSCERTKFFHAFNLIYQKNPQDLFDHDQHRVEGICEYCKKIYSFEKSEFLSDKV
jgi:redox-regulated HSP33 family molecular chaperone